MSRVDTGIPALPSAGKPTSPHRHFSKSKAAPFCSPFVLSEHLSDGLKPSGSPQQVSWGPLHQNQTLAAAAGHRWGEITEPREEPMLGQRDAGSARCSARLPAPSCRLPPSTEFLSLLKQCILSPKQCVISQENTR